MDAFGGKVEVSPKLGFVLEEMKTKPMVFF